jgi:hypothetical protein
MTTKICKNCKLEKPLSDYYNHRKKNHHPNCIQCHNEKGRRQNKERYLRTPTENLKEIQKISYNKFCEKKSFLKKNNIEAYNEIINKRKASQKKCWFNNHESNKERGRKRYIKNKDYRLRKSYGITLEEFNLMLKSQNNKCKICEKTFEEGRQIKTDHCHSIGKVRGLLCHGCNASLGLIKENTKTLKNMIKYINESLPLQHKLKI